MRVLIIFLVLLLLSQPAFAQLRSNASSVTVDLSSSKASRGIVFSPPTRDLFIRNNDANDYIWVDLKSSTHGKNIDGSFDFAKCMLIAPGDNIELYDFLTDGITIIKDLTYSGNGASPVSVEAIF